MTATNYCPKHDHCAALMGKIIQLEQLVKRYEFNNAKLTEENKDLQDDLAELSKSVQGMGEGGLSQSDREIRERMFEDMHKLVQKVGVLEKRNSVLEGENAKLRSLLDEKTKAAQVRAQEDRPGSARGLLVPEQGELVPTINISTCCSSYTHRHD